MFTTLSFLQLSIKGWGVVNTNRFLLYGTCCEFLDIRHLQMLKYVSHPPFINNILQSPQIEHCCRMTTWRWGGGMKRLMQELATLREIFAQIVIINFASYPIYVCIWLNLLCSHPPTPWRITINRSVYLVLRARRALMRALNMTRAIWRGGPWIVRFFVALWNGNEGDSPSCHFGPQKILTLSHSAIK